MTRDVFISHSSRDHDLAVAVCASIEQRGLKCWIAPRDIHPGQPWGASIVQALDECPVLVLVLTENANVSHHVVREIERADGKLSRIITFRVDDLILNPSLEYFLSADHWLDATTQPVERHFPALVDAVVSLHGLGRNTAKPPMTESAIKSPLPPMSDSEMVKAFDELAPDDWEGVRPGRVSRFFQHLFSDR